MQGRIVIPLHNEQGELVGYAGRWPGEPPEGEPKYKFPPKFHKSAVLLNLWRTCPCGRPASTIPSRLSSCPRNTWGS